MPFKELCQLSVSFELHTVCSNSLISHHQSVCSLKLVFIHFAFLCLLDYLLWPHFMSHLFTSRDFWIFRLQTLVQLQRCDCGIQRWVGTCRASLQTDGRLGNGTVLEKICLECSGEKKKTGHTFITEPKGWLKVTVILMLFRTPEPSR